MSSFSIFNFSRFNFSESTLFQKLKKTDLRTSLFIAGLMLGVMIMEFTTPSGYVFSYLYIGPILLTSSRLSRFSILLVTLVSAFLTMLNAWIPDIGAVSDAIVASRAIAVLAMVVSAILSDRNRRYEEALARQQAKLQAQEKLASIREDFVSTLTHDLKTPVLGAIETLKAFRNGNFGIVTPPQKSVLATLLRSHQANLHLVETLLDIYRNDAQGLKLHCTPVELVTLAEESAGTLTEIAASRHIYITLNHGTSDFRHALWVQADALQLRRVFSNLLMNAIYHSRRDGRVEVVLKTQGDEHVVQILDTGLGIAESELPHLFERFYQGQGDRQVNGSGLGLYLSRQIITAHGGTIWAENRPQSGALAEHAVAGALFGFRLPVYPSFPMA